jgi:hypothetical protein
MQSLQRELLAATGDFLGLFAHSMLSMSAVSRQRLASALCEAFGTGAPDSVADLVRRLREPAAAPCPMPRVILRFDLNLSRVA